MDERTCNKMDMSRVVESLQNCMKMPHNPAIQDSATLMTITTEGHFSASRQGVRSLRPKPPQKGYCDNYVNENGPRDESTSITNPLPPLSAVQKSPDSCKVDADLRNCSFRPYNIFMKNAVAPVPHHNLRMKRGPDLFESLEDCRTPIVAWTSSLSLPPRLSPRKGVHGVDGGRSTYAHDGLEDLVHSFPLLEEGDVDGQDVIVEADIAGSRRTRVDGGLEDGTDDLSFARRLKMRRTALYPSSPRSVEHVF
jgi:hypothetical protein